MGIYCQCSDVPMTEEDAYVLAHKKRIQNSRHFEKVEKLLTTKKRRDYMRQLKRRGKIWCFEVESTLSSPPTSFIHFPIWLVLGWKILFLMNFFNCKPSWLGQTSADIVDRQIAGNETRLKMKKIHGDKKRDRKGGGGDYWCSLDSFGWIWGCWFYGVFLIIFLQLLFQQQFWSSHLPCQISSSTNKYPYYNLLRTQVTRKSLWSW